MPRFLRNLLCALQNAFRRPAAPSESSFPLLPGTSVQIDFSGFTKGIDNVRIDVRLSPQFAAQVKRIIASLLDQEIGRSRWGQQSAGPSRQDWEAFRGSYARMLEAAIHRAKVQGGRPLVQLVQMGAVKFLLGQVQIEFDQLRQGLKGAMASGGSTADANRMDITERLSWLVRNRARLRYKVNKQLFAQLLKAEEPLLELRQSLMGERWSIPEEVLFNPLLQAESLLDDEIMMKHYVLMGQGVDDPYSFASIDSSFPYVFRRSKPISKTEMALVAAEQAHKRLVEELEQLRRQREKSRNTQAAATVDSRKADLATQLQKANAELERLRAAYLKDSYGWAETPANVDILFDRGAFKESVKTAAKEKDRTRLANLNEHSHFQRRMLAVVERHFRGAGLLTQVAAAYELVPLYRDYAGALTAQELHQFLSGRTKQKEIVKKVKEKQVSGKPLPIGPLTQAARRVAGMPCRQERDYLVRFLKDFITFRRDLSNYHLAHKAMNAIQLQDDPKNIRLSRTNRTLYEFLGTKEEGAVAQTVLNHVILKADVRGSTTMVAELRNRGLNPASHFSLNFFGPLNEVLETYGAGKVFIEGDAVILSLIEHEEELEHQFSVARMCGIAKRLLGMVQAQNALCRKEGLPELELGVGLVFSEEPPTFLYDGNNQIMISSAIGKADRLSSCSWMLRKQRSQTANTYTNVDIYEIPEGDPLRGEKGEVHLRYNLNGIELDDAGFAKLQKEITLQQLSVRLAGDDEPLTLHVGGYPDLKGAMHRVVVREGRMRLFDKRHPKFGEPTQSVFYEVVTNQSILDRVKDQIKGEGAGKTEE
ncbi:MAG TPA: hypothetical protein VGQ60_05695 [Nitrospiraceae bacterium]|jgi:hypothetical protein|nr:hypothetical protein [Nitrospiraceae bacterium]